MSGLLASCAVLLVLAVAGAHAMCPIPSKGGKAEWIDPETTQCVFPLCTQDNYLDCKNATKYKPTQMKLVFSDEFNKEDKDRPMGVEKQNPKWTAQDMWYDATVDFEVYKPEQVTMEGGAAVITMEHEPVKEKRPWAPVQRGNGSVWNVTKAYKSGFFDSWNKFCYTGGYLEAGLQFPGDDWVSGFWPAFWLMGNLGRAGYLKATKGIWPYTYNSCEGGMAGLDREGAMAPQNLSACADPEGYDRTEYGLKPGVGRGAPEIDMVEIKVSASVNEKVKVGFNNETETDLYEPYDPATYRPTSENGSKPMALNSMTLQLGPLLPNGTTWNDPSNTGGPNGPGPLGKGMHLPGWERDKDGTLIRPGPQNNKTYTHTTYWTNDGGFSYGLLDHFTNNTPVWLEHENRTTTLQERYGNPETAAETFLMLQRPGSLIQDSVSVYADLGPEFFNNNSKTAPATQFHKFGLDWKPDQYVRWYIDDKMVYEVTKEAVRAQGNGTYTTEDRLIPKEALYIIFNFAMSDKFTRVDIQRLIFPAWYKIDYVRVYQDENATNLGCSPPEYPTAQYLACNRDTYIVQQQDEVLIPDMCEKKATCRSEWGYDYMGGNLWTKAGKKMEYLDVEMPQDCCRLCQHIPECNAWSWNPYFNLTCSLKSHDWVRRKTEPEYEGIISGTVYNANSSVPRSIGNLETKSSGSLPRYGVQAAGGLVATLLCAVALLLLLVS